MRYNWSARLFHVAGSTFKNIIYQWELNTSTGKRREGGGAVSGARQMIARHADSSARAHLVSVINQKFTHASLRSSWAAQMPDSWTAGNSFPLRENWELWETLLCCKWISSDAFAAPTSAPKCSRKYFNLLSLTRNGTRRTVQASVCGRVCVRVCVLVCLRVCPQLF